jgi:TRAP-type C4-dicarboxylate transport system permease small subunit
MKSSAIDLRRQPLELALCVILVALVGVTFAQVLFRYVFQLSLSWSEEVARFLLMWMASLSAAYAFKTRSHFALRFVVDRLAPTMRQRVAMVVTVAVVGFLAVFAWQALRFTLEVRTMVAPATGISMAIPYSSALFGSLLMLFYVGRQALAGEFEPPDHAEP